MQNRVKYPLTDEAKEAANYLLDAWNSEKIDQYFTVMDATTISATRVKLHGTLGILSDKFELPRIRSLLELSNFNLLEITDREQSVSENTTQRIWEILLTQELRNAVKNDFYVSDYFLTLNAVGNIIIMAENSSVGSVQGAASNFGNIAQEQTINSSEIADKLIEQLGQKFLESNQQVAQAINQLREAPEKKFPERLGAVVSELGRSIGHTANTAAVISAIVAIAPYIT